MDRHILLIALSIAILSLAVLAVRSYRKSINQSSPNNRRSDRRRSKDGQSNGSDCYFCAVVKHADLDQSIAQTDSECSSPSSNSQSSNDSLYGDSQSPKSINGNLLHRTFSPFLTTIAEPMPVIQYSTPFVVVFGSRSPASQRHLLIVPRHHFPPVKQLISSPESECEDDVDGDDESEDDGWEPRKRYVESPEEKELTPSQLIHHMYDVGKLLLARPELLRSRNAGVRNVRQSACKTLRSSTWARQNKIFKRNHQSDESADESDEHEQLVQNHQSINCTCCDPGHHSDEEKMIDVESYITQRKRTPSCHHTPILTLHSSSTSHHQNDSLTDSHHRNDSLIDSHSQNEQRLCFRVPARCQNAHLVMHALELPIISWRSRAKFQTGTPWCWSVEETLKRCKE